MFRAARIVAIAAFVAYCAATSVLAADEIGHVSRVQNSAWALSTGTNRSLEPGSPVYTDDVLSTGNGARLEVVFADGTSLTLGQNAVIEVDGYAYEPESESGSAAWDILSGAFLMVTGQIAKSSPEDVSIRTPVAYVGIRGTEFWAGLIDDGYGVLVLEGIIEVTSPGGSVMLDMVGEGTMIAEPGAAPSDPIIWGDGKKARALEAVSFAP
jgi:hypothetical protein